MNVAIHFTITHLIFYNLPTLYAVVIPALVHSPQTDTHRMQVDKHVLSDVQVESPGIFKLFTGKTCRKYSLSRYLN